MPDSINLNNMLETNGWALIEFDRILAQSLREKAVARYQNRDFKPASLAQLQNQKIRNDQIFWLEAETHDAAEKKTLHLIKDYMQAIKDYFRIPLRDFECHYACYPAEHFYQKHSDQKLQDNKRYFSFVIYLNDSWLDTDGGQLVGYDSDQKEIFRLLPTLGTMILFRSDIIHEVLPSKKERFSLTGWMRTAS